MRRSPMARDCVSGIGSLVDQQAQHGPVASVTTAWRLIHGRVDAAHLAGVKAARAAATWKRTFGFHPLLVWE